MRPRGPAQALTSPVPSSPMLVAVLDACVLYPIRVCNVLLWSAQADLVAVRWTEEILEEARRNVLADRPDLTPGVPMMRRGIPLNHVGVQLSVDGSRSQGTLDWDR